MPPLLLAEPVGVDAATRVLVVDDALRATGPAGDRRLREHAAGFGPEGLSGAIRNALGLRIDSVLELTESQLVALLKPVVPIEVVLDVAIREDGETVYEAGPHSMTATEIVTFLAFPFADQSVDSSERMRLVTSAWAAIARTPGLAGAAGRSRIPAAARDAMAALARAEVTEPLAVAETSNGVVLDEPAYRAQAAAFEGAWIGAVEPSDRPRLELRGRNLVEAMLVLISGGYRIEIARDVAVRESTVETSDRTLGLKLLALLDVEDIVEPAEPLGSGIAARISLAGRA